MFLKTNESSSSLSTTIIVFKTKINCVTFANLNNKHPFQCRKAKKQKQTMCFTHIVNSNLATLLSHSTRCPLYAS